MRAVLILTVLACAVATQTLAQGTTELEPIGPRREPITDVEVASLSLVQEDISLQPLLDTASNETKSWWSRHPVLTGALAGAIIGAGGYYLAVRNDEYCRDPDMFPCEIGYPFYAAGGAAVGALIGWAASPPRRGAGEKAAAPDALRR